MRDDYYTDSDVKLSFSLDTLRFDTVFTSVGSATRYVKVYNPLDAPIQVQFSLRKQAGKTFRFNVNGFHGPSTGLIDINAKDSIYIFVETTIDPNQPISVSPFIVEDQIYAEVNGKISTLYLEAWGQNANYIPSSKKGGGYNFLTCDLGQVTWDDPKPYVIYGVLVIDSCTLVLPPGTRIYVHGGVVRNSSTIYNDGLIAVGAKGKLLSLGSLDKPVTFQGDRLEKEFGTEAGQWVGLLISATSKANQMIHTHIFNSIIGVYADSLSSLDMRKCKIFNTASAGITGRHSTIRASNCLIYGTGSYAVNLFYGGQYNFEYCTMATFSGKNESLHVSDFYCKSILCEEGIWFNRIDATFTNCIITGGNEDEIALVNKGETSLFNVFFDHCALKFDKRSTFPIFNQSHSACTFLRSEDRVFNDYPDNDYRLDTMSVVLTKATPLQGISDDILDKTRISDVDPGCYEF
jgi:hypothetical protein